jgi:hypothetical protein
LGTKVIPELIERKVPNDKGQDWSTMKRKIASKGPKKTKKQKMSDVAGRVVWPGQLLKENMSPAGRSFDAIIQKHIHLKGES